MDEETVEIFLKSVCDGFDKCFNCSTKVFHEHDDPTYWIDISSNDLMDNETGELFIQGFELSRDDIEYALENKGTFFTIRQFYVTFNARVNVRRTLANARQERAGQQAG